MQQWLKALAFGSLAMCALTIATPPSKEQLELALPRLIASDRESEALALIESYLSIHPDDAQVLFDASRIASHSGDPRGAAVYAIRSLRASSSCSLDGGVAIPSAGIASDPSANAINHLRIGIC